MGMMIHRRREGHLHYPKVEHKEEVQQGPVEVHDEPVEEKKGVVYTLDEINKLPFFSLKSLATQHGIDVKGKKAAEIRTDLKEKLEL